MGSFLYGTSSWSEKTWSGAFYPAGLRASEWLTYYATRFQTVEADVTYYRVPDREMVRRWERRTPERFVLSAKFPRSVVHAGDGARPDPAKVLAGDAAGADTHEFLDAMSLLGSKCGPLVLQFPYFNRSVFAGPEPFLERLERFLDGLPDAFRYGVEIRNKAWIDEPLLALLRRRRAALVLVEIGYMPHPASLMQHRDLFTTDFVYARLIGDRKAVEARTERFDRIVLDQEERLARWSGLLREAIERVPETFAYANNHYAGFGPETIRRLAAMVAGEKEPGG